jgi:hypothetical protein
MADTVSVLCLTEGVAGVVGEAAEILNRSQKILRFEVGRHSGNLPPPDLGPVYSWELLKSVLTAAKAGLKARFLFGVLDHPIENNWFSKTYHKEGVGFVTVDGWESISDLPTVAFVAVEFVENLAEYLLGHIVFHDETRGCLHDMCTLKPHISFKIRTADICRECWDAYRQRLDPAVLEATVAMLEEVRRVALGRGTPTPAPAAGRPAPEMADRDFPFPLAYCLRSMQVELSYSRKWLKLLELYEVTLKYFTFVLLAAWHQSEQGLPSAVAAQVANLVRPSAGHWHSACFALLRSLQEAGHPCFLDHYLAGVSGQSVSRALAASQKLVPERNDTRGHGFVEEEARYQGRYEVNHGHLQALLDLVAPLSHYRLIKVGEGLRRRQGVSTFPARLLMGACPLFPPQQHETHEEIDTDCLLHDPETGKYLSLYPWLLLEDCPRCYREMVFVYDKLDGDAVVLREYPTNHTQTRRNSLHRDVKARLQPP